MRFSSAALPLPRGAESVYRLIVETMKEAAFTVTFDGTILYCNGQLGEFLGRPVEQVIGHRLAELVAPDIGPEKGSGLC